MITKFKIFETTHNIISNVMKEGYYVLLISKDKRYRKSWIPDATWNVINNQIGKITLISFGYGEVDVDFGEDIGKLRGISMNNIKYWSDNKEELEIIRDSEKYNL